MDTRNELLESAIRLVAKNGMENIRTKEIAEDVGISEGTMYKHFKSKNEILRDAFFLVDTRISSILTQSSFASSVNIENFWDMVHEIWEKIYSYLLSHEEETLFLIRFRYSALYTAELRKKRQAYNGMFDEIYKSLEKIHTLPPDIYRGFLTSYIFEITLCFAEKYVTGRIPEDDSLEDNLWNAVKGAVVGMLGIQAL